MYYRHLRSKFRQRRNNINKNTLKIEKELSKNYCQNDVKKESHWPKNCVQSLYIQIISCLIEIKEKDSNNLISFNLVSMQICISKCIVCILKIKLAVPKFPLQIIQRLRDCILEMFRWKKLLKIKETREIVEVSKRQENRVILEEIRDWPNSSWCQWRSEHHQH